MANDRDNAEHPVVAGDWTSVPNVHRFVSRAMNATFGIVIQHADPVYARQAADAAFALLPLIEADLSRYIHNSDISQINRLSAGEPLTLGFYALECLELSRRMYAETGGVFDVTAGLLVDCWRDEDKKPRTPSAEELAFARAHTGMSLLKLDESRRTVELSIGGVRVDLGGIGKGYAVDKMADLLGDWSIDCALLHGGFSSVLALEPPEGAPGWPVTLSDPHDRRRRLARIALRRGAIAGSGLKKGPHIIDPRSGQPADSLTAAWSLAPNAGAADALSTAFTIMSPQQTAEYCATHEDTRALLVVPQAAGPDRVVAAGMWPEGELVY